MATSTPAPGPNRAEIWALIERLRNKLLDLTRRNRLLNVQFSPKRSLRFVAGDLALTFDHLVGPQRCAKIEPIPDPPRSSWVLRNDRVERPNAEEWAVANGIPTGHNLPEGTKNGLRAMMYADTLAWHCRQLERANELELAEKGTNPLHLVLGFLQYPEDGGSSGFNLAPLVCIPVKLTAAIARGRTTYSLLPASDDLAENVSLREKLLQDYDLCLPDFDDQPGSLESYFAAIAEVVDRQPRFALLRHAALCMLGFGNLEMYRQMSPENWPGLVDVPLIRMLFGSDSSPNPSSGDGGQPDVEQAPANAIPLICDADSSQHAALADVLCNGQSLVVQGPPGTGKSQTIANLIAGCLAQGKSVLFVAEKLVALRVVAERLERAGLGQFVLPLHSDRALRSEVLTGLKQRLDLRVRTAPDIEDQLKRVERRRKQLTLYADNLNRVLFNQLGLTVHQVFWRTEFHRRRLGGRESLLLGLQLEHPDRITHSALDRVEECLRDLSVDFERYGPYGPSRTFWGFKPNYRAVLERDEVHAGLLELLEPSAQFEDSAAAWQSYCDSTSAVLDRASAIALKGEIAHLADRFDPALPLRVLTLVAGIERQAANDLNRLEEMTVRARRLSDTVNRGLRSGASPDADRLDRLIDLQRLAAALGVTWGNIAGIQNWLTESGLLAQRIATVIASLRTAGTVLDWDPTAIADGVELARQFAAEAAASPRECLDLQSPQLCNSGAVADLERLSSQCQIIDDLKQDLETSAYLDQVPDIAKLQVAVAVFRRHRGVFRWLSSDFRSSCRILAPVWKLRIPPGQRRDLTAKLAEMVSAQSALRDSDLCKVYLPHQDKALSSEVGRRLRLARWNASVSAHVAAAGLEVTFSTPASVRSLIIALTRLHGAAFAAGEVIGSLRLLLPGIDVDQPLVVLDEQLSTLRNEAAAQLSWLETRCPPGATLVEIIAACEADKAYREVATEALELPLHCLGAEFQGIASDVTRLQQVLATAIAIADAPIDSGIKRELRAQPASHSRICRNLETIISGFGALEHLQDSLKDYGEFSPEEWIGCAPQDGLHQFARCFHARLIRATASFADLAPWQRRLRDQRRAADLGIQRLVSTLEAENVPAAIWPDAYRYLVYRSIARKVMQEVPVLGEMERDRHAHAIEEFRSADQACIRARGMMVAQAAVRTCETEPGNVSGRVEDLTEMALVRHLLPQVRPRVSIRALLARSWKSVLALTPCFMMNPPAVARFFGPERTFDVVIMDEASQLTPAVAIGAIGHARQLVVVGDNKQLPPTAFFQRTSSDTEAEEEFVGTEAESILDVCSARLPTRRLRWHYRSRHESLIAFSNHRFYEGELIVFPAPFREGGGLGLRTIYIGDAVYLDQRNEREAQRIVDLALEHIRLRPEESLGLITLNRSQCDLVDELWRQRLQLDQVAAEWEKHQRDLGQPVFVRNLENVQGDERDAILISTTFGKPPGAAAVRQNFGPISRTTGWRRLNVLFTRARNSMTLVTSLLPGDLVVTEGTPEGTRIFRDFLEYARTGLLESEVPTGLAPDSDFEREVIARVQDLGYECTPQLGVAGFRLDIGVKHPDSPGAYLAGIECDGASYHSGRTARDRDRIRQEILESVGWRNRLWRIWSTDWFISPSTEITRLAEFLRGLRESWHPEPITADRWQEERRAVSPTHTTAEVEPTGTVAVALGDTVRYVKLGRLDEPITVQISANHSDPANGIIGAGAPLAQCLLDAVVGDEVTLHIPGQLPQVLRLVQILRPPADLLRNSQA